MLCCPSWSVGEWGVCSRSCGGGEQTRQVQCVQRTSQTNVDALADSRCAQPTPARRQACSTHSCPPVWAAGPWSQVSTCESDLCKNESFQWAYTDGRQYMHAAVAVSCSREKHFKVAHSPKELYALCCEVNPSIDGFTTFYNADLSGFKL